MKDREKLLRRVALKCADFARQLAYHRALNAYRDQLRANFWIYTYNNAIDLAVLDWFHLFGYHNDDLHWKQVVPTVAEFRHGLHEYIRMNEDQWKEYWAKVKNYRDKDIAHIEVRPRSHVPDMATALRATTYYYNYVISQLSEFGDYSHWPSDLEEYHKKSLVQSEKIVAVAYASTQSLREEVH